jgi:hypothetical protein
MKAVLALAFFAPALYAQTCGTKTVTETAVVVVTCAPGGKNCGPPGSPNPATSTAKVRNSTKCWRSSFPRSQTASSVISNLADHVDPGELRRTSAGGRFNLSRWVLRERFFSCATVLSRAAVLSKRPVSRVPFSCRKSCRRYYLQPASRAGNLQRRYPIRLHSSKERARKGYHHQLVRLRRHHQLSRLQ